MIKRIVIVSLFLVSAIQGLAQKKYAEFSREDYLTDFDFLVNIIKNQHPNPYRFISEEDFDKKIVQVRQALSEEPTYQKFLLSNPLPFIHDAHVGMSVDATVFEDYANTARFFPLATTVFNDHVFVNQYSKDIPVGAVLKQVNGYEVQDLLDSINVNADGGIKADNAKDFSLYCSLRFAQSPQYTLTYVDSLGGSELKEVVLPSVDYARSYYNSQKTILPTELLSYSYGIFSYPISESVHYLTIKTFGFSEEFAYQKLSSLFEYLNKHQIENLIIDIRGNGGGLLSNIPLYYSFISQQKMFKTSYQYASRLIHVNVSENLVDSNGRQLSDMDIKNMDNYMYQRYNFDAQSGYFYGNSRLDESYGENYPADRKAYQGNITLLIDNNTVSAAAYFASLFKSNNRGVIVGEQTRTCSNFTTASWFINYKLPNTQTKIDLPRSEVFFNDQFNLNTSCQGVMPDYSVSDELFYRSLMQAQDPQLSLALKIIEQQDSLSK